MAKAVIGWQRIIVWNTPFLPPSCTRACNDTSIIVGSSCWKSSKWKFWKRIGCNITLKQLTTAVAHKLLPTTLCHMAIDHLCEHVIQIYSMALYVLLPWLLFIGMHNDSMFLHELYLHAWTTTLYFFLSLMLPCSLEELQDYRFLSTKIHD